MDSRDSLHPPQHHHQPPQHHQPPPQHSQSLMMSPPPHPPSQHPYNNNSHHHSINPNSITATYQQQQQHQHHHQQQQNTRFPFNSDTLNSPYGSGSGGGGDGSSPSSAGFRAGGSGGGGFSNEPKKKRGRPRKYSPSPDGGNNNIVALGLAPAPITTTPVSNVGGVGGHADSNDGAHSTPMSDTSGKKARGRPAGSGKKQLDALGSPGIGFTPHVIEVKTGEDIASKIMAFSQQGPRTVCILSANGAICNVTLRQPAMSGGTVTYEGRFEIISLSGSFLLSESNGNRSRTGGLSVSLAGSDGRVLGGGVAGMLMAATPVQVIVGSFIADGKKTKSGSSSTPPTNMLNFGAPVPGASPPSEGGSSESSDESGGSSPNNNNRISTPNSSYNNAASTQQQPIQNIPMYATNMGWANSTINMLPN